MEFISFEESMRILHKSIKTLNLTQKVFTPEALGRVLAKDIVAKENSPKFKTAAMDGYAIRWEDQKLKRLKIVDLVPAGSEAKKRIQKGECVKTFTGSLKSTSSILRVTRLEEQQTEAAIIPPASSIQASIVPPNRLSLTPISLVLQIFVLWELQR